MPNRQLSIASGCLAQYAHQCDHRSQCDNECHDLRCITLREYPLHDPDVRPMDGPDERQREHVYPHEIPEHPAARSHRRG